MRNNDLMDNFLWGHTKGKSSSLSIEGDKLYSYGTVIAQRINGVVHLNTTKYSATTSRSQFYLKRQIPEAPTVTNVPMGAGNLSQYVLQEA